jgi:N-ethylmaleimide reductase
MTSSLAKNLLTPVQIGRLTLRHRIVMPALSRLRAQPGSGIPSDLMLEYYSQRASGGGLIVTEATAIAPSARGYYHAPGLYTKEQEAGWSRVTNAVHAKGGYMFAQLWHAGRTTHSAITGTEPVTASVDPAYAAASHVLVDTPEGFLPPSSHRTLGKAEIAGVLTQYGEAALHANLLATSERELLGQWRVKNRVRPEGVNNCCFVSLLHGHPQCGFSRSVLES